MKKEEKSCQNKSFRDNTAKPQFSRLDPSFIDAMAAHLTKCAIKYPDIDGKPNWQRPVDNIKQDILDSAMRHMLALYKNEEKDEETGTHHAVSVGVNLMFYYWQVNK